MIVTFIIIAYNAGKYIEKSFSCLLKQDYDLKKIEVILVDSNSTDNTKKIMMNYQKKYASKFNSFKVLDNPNKTLPNGWNVALKEAHGDAILRVDAHTTFNKDFISLNVKEIKNGASIVGGKCESITLNNTRKEKLLLIAEESIFGAGIADFRRSEEKKYVSTLAFAMYQKKVFDDVGLYNINLARTEDNEMHYRMRKKGYKFLFVPEIKTYRYARSDFKGLVKQKYGNGKWIGITMYYCPKCFSLYHFVPLFFVIGLLLSIILCFYNFPYILYLIAVLYALFNIINIFLISLKNKFHLEYLLLPIIFFILHFSYGFGTIVGLIMGPFYKRRRRK